MGSAAITPATTRSGGVGHSDAGDGATAGREAVRAALRGRPAAAGDLVLLFASAHLDLDALLAAATAAAAPAALVGATGCGAFTSEATVAEGVVAVHLRGDAFGIGIAHVDRDDADLRGSGRRVAALARDRAGNEQEHATLLLLCDGRAADQREIARGAYEITSALVPLVGAAAGDDLRWEATWTFGEGRRSDRGLVGVWITSPRPLGVSHDRAWRPVGQPMLVTRSEGSTVRELDGRPALDVYLEQSGIDVTARADLAVALMRNPVGIPSSLGAYDVRQLHGFDRDRRLVVTTAISEQSLLQVMESDADAMLDGAAQAAAEAAAALEHAPTLAVAFSCCTRPLIMGDRTGEEVAAISAALGGIPVGGVFTTGEFARATGSVANHNSTLALLVL